LKEGIGGERRPKDRVKTGYFADNSDVSMTFGVVCGWAYFIEMHASKRVLDPVKRTI
jgi:hypothetical protein